MSYIKVQNAEGLVRDMSTNAIINTDESKYSSYLNKRAQIEDRKRQINKQSEEIDALKNEMLEIKQLLMELIKGK